MSKPDHEKELDEVFYGKVSLAILDNAGNQDPSESDTKQMVERVKMFFQINEGLVWRNQISDDKASGMSKAEAKKKMADPLTEKLQEEKKKHVKKAA